jgi:dTDP-4-amino-4,6-dideoxygalactose transaminase
LIPVEKALTFPNATSALMLSLKLMNLSGEVILPSFTFCATGHAVVWNGLKPVFADIDLHTFNIDPKDVERKITDQTSAIIAVHIFGNPCDIAALEKIARRHNLKLIFDSAHALGSKYYGKSIGCFGDVECFSLSGTKVITSAEGGIATSNDSVFMEKMALGRNYGAGNDYNCCYMGLNGKMSEFHAAIAIESLFLLPELVNSRCQLAAIYRSRLSEIPGISFQEVHKENFCTYKDFAIIIDKNKFGMDRDTLIAKLQEEDIYTKRYFYPPLHEMDIYKSIDHCAKHLENTKKIASNIVCLPIYSHMRTDTIEKICFVIYRIFNKV